MTRRPRPSPPLALPMLVALLAGGTIGLPAAWSQDRPHAPAAPDEEDAPEAADPGSDTGPAGRRPQSDEPTTLAFKNASVDQIIPFIVEATGKVVLPQPDVLGRRITIVNDQPIARERALDLVIFALHQYGIAVVESEDLIILRDIAEITRQDVPVLGPHESVLRRTDLGTIVEKVFALRNASAENIGEIIEGTKPDFAKVSIDAESNQVAVMGNIGLLQRLERLIASLDQPNAASLSTETFHLRFADAEQISENIKELFGVDSGNRAGRNQQNQNPFNFFRQGGGGPGAQPAQPGRGGGQPGRGNQGGSGAGRSDDAATSENLRVTANTQQNSVTVLAEPTVLDQIREQVLGSWDRPLPEEAVVPRIYDLKNSDAVKVRDLLNNLFGSGATQAAAGGGGGGGGAGGGGNAPAAAQGAGRLAGQFSFEAVPEASRLVVVAKSPDNLAVIDKIIQDLDQPQNAGLPRIVELKHASAEELAEQLNALLSQEGTLAQIARAETGLSEGTSGSSPFAADQATTTNQNQNQQGTTPDTMTFWWQRARPPTTTSGPSNLISKIRIVPVWRQNALMIMSPPEYQASVVNLVEQLDRPGRQVLLSAVIAEISLDDATALGLRWSNAPITPALGDNTISLGANTAGSDAGGIITGTKNNLLPGLFDTSVLNVGVDVNLLLQALNQKTGVSILSEPRIFTSDNQEAEFFNGQDIPFITDTQTTDNGTLNETFDYRAVGISLRVRPRITVKRDVDLRINLELSSVQPNQTLFGGFIVDRRETTTHLIVQDGQTVVVSGILRTEDSDIKRKVPLLGDIPLVGLLFQSTEKTKARTELVAFITPVVIENPGEADDAYREDRERLRDLRDQMRPPAPPDPRKQPPPPPTPAEELGT